MSSVNETVVEFPFDPKSQQGNQLNIESLQVVVDGPASVAASLIKKNGQSFVTFTTTLTGEYKVSITQNGTHIVHSPMTVTVKPKEAGEQTRAPTLPPTSAAASQEKNPVKFQVEAKDHEGNPITSKNDIHVSVSGPENIPSVNVELQHGQLLIGFERDVAEGEFTVSVKHHGHDIQRSPFTLTLSKSSGDRAAREIATLDN